MTKRTGCFQNKVQLDTFFFGDGFNLLHIAWEEMSTSGPVPHSCCWGMRDVWGSWCIRALLLSIKSPMEAQGSCQRAIPLPTKPDPILTVSLQGGQGELLAKTVVFSLLPLRVGQKVSTGWIIFASTHFLMAALLLVGGYVSVISLVVLNIAQYYIPDVMTRAPAAREPSAHPLCSGGCCSPSSGCCPSS